MRKVLKDTTVAQPRVSLRPTVAARPLAAQRTLAAHAEPVQRAPEAPKPDDALVRQWRQAAERAGYEAGLKQAQADAQARFDAESARITGLMREIREAHAELVAAQSASAEQFAFAVLCRMLGEAAISQEAITGAAQAVIREAGHDTLSLRVHPDDAQVLRILLEADGQDRLQIEPDEGIRLGGCIARTAEGCLDASFDTQLELLAKALEDARSRRGTEPHR